MTLIPEPKAPLHHQGRLATCDSGVGAGRLADSGRVPGAHGQVVSCAARHRQLIVGGGQPVGGDLRQGLWAVLDPSAYLHQVLHVRTVHAPP